MDELENLVTSRIEGDSEFQTQLASLPDDERQSVLQERRNQIIAEEFKTLTDKEKKSSELAINYKTRAEKAEKEKGGGSSEKKDELSTLDAILIAKANVELDDIETVVKYAKFEGLSVKDALATPELKAILSVRIEERKTAEASAMRNHRGTPTTQTPDQIIDKGRQGNAEEKDIDALVNARHDSMGKK